MSFSLTLTTPEWYAFGLGLTLFIAATMSAIDVWLNDIKGPNLRLKLIVLMARWSFLGGIISFAFLIDSKRVYYSEPEIWAFLVGGICLCLIFRLCVGRAKK